MWTRPTLPSSNWRNAPYGVMRCTVPSTTAPTSSSAIGTPFERKLMGRALSHRRKGASIEPPATSIQLVLFGALVRGGLLRRTQQWTGVLGQDQLRLGHLREIKEVHHVVG